MSEEEEIEGRTAGPARKERLSRVGKSGGLNVSSSERRDLLGRLASVDLKARDQGSVSYDRVYQERKEGQLGARSCYRAAC
jgi:hypothetical protein